MAGLINDMCTSTSCRVVLDIGAGLVSSTRTRSLPSLPLLTRSVLYILMGLESSNHCPVQKWLGNKAYVSVVMVERVAELGLADLTQ